MITNITLALSNNFLTKALLLNVTYPNKFEEFYIGKTNKAHFYSGYDIELFDKLSWYDFIDSLSKLNFDEATFGGHIIRDDGTDIKTDSFGNPGDFDIYITPTIDICLPKQAWIK